MNKSPLNILTSRDQQSVYLNLLKIVDEKLNFIQKIFIKNIPSTKLYYYFEQVIILVYYKVI